MNMYILQKLLIAKIFDNGWLKTAIKKSTGIRMFLKIKEINVKTILWTPLLRKLVYFVEK